MKKPKARPTKVVKKNLQNNADEIIRLLVKYYPDAHCALDHSNAHELLFATILSAQCTDERVNQVTPVLFKKYPTVKALSDGRIEDIQEIIRSTGFFNNKSKSLKNCALSLVNEHNGEVPKDMDALTKLAGVGRKTANVVLGNAFGIASGVVVDTHVSRLSQRLGLTKNKTPEKIEQDLMKIVPENNWVQFSHWLITHGRKVCVARKPRCSVCFLQEVCATAYKV
jgi:endonuclease-3